MANKSKNVAKTGKMSGKGNKRLQKVTKAGSTKEAKGSFLNQVSSGSISTKVLGEAGESIAAYHMKSKGYRLIGRNIRFKRGEVDILALKDGIIRIIEVKTVLVRSEGPLQQDVQGPGLEVETGQKQPRDVIHETRFEQFEPEYNFTQAKLSRLKGIAAEIVSKYPYPLLHLLDYDAELTRNSGVINDGGEIHVQIEGLAVRIHVDKTAIKSIKVRHIEDLVS